MTMNVQSQIPRGPLLAPDDEPPGRVVAGKWEGALDWRTRHGPATVQWSTGAPSYVWNARTPEDGRVNLSGRAPASDMFRVDADRPFVLGRIAITRDDVTFSCVDEKAYADVDGGLRPLLELLLSDAAFVADIVSPASAGALYHMIENEEFTSGDGAVFAFGQRSAANFVAATRDLGEDYLDFAWGRGPAFVQTDIDRVRAHFERLGIVLRAAE